ncbi:MAG: hypothetical protein WBF13_05485 [Candidatus Zixiibacteriota bacterium]
MADNQLVKKFLFGANNYPIYVPGTPEYDFFIGIPQRQDKLVKLAQAQLSAQYDMAKSIEAGSSYIATEIEQFSAELGGAISQLDASVARSGDNVVNAMGNLEYSLICEFREVRWLLSQIGAHSEEVIAILKNKRKVEANELLEQALSNLKTGYYQEAKDRLFKALEFDNTDYQIHRNLGFVFLHEENATKAIEHFQKAVAFSPTESCKVGAMVDLSRAFYADDSFADAAKHLSELIDDIDHDPNIVTRDEYARILYNHSVYSGLAGEIDTCLANLQKAIELRRTYFVLAFIDQDLEKIRTPVNEFLAGQTNMAVKEAERSLLSSFSKRKQADKMFESNSLSSIVEVDRNLNIAESKLKVGSYTDLIDIKANCLALNGVMDSIQDHDGMQKNLKMLEEDLEKDEVRLKEYEEKERNEIKALEISESRSAESRELRAIILRGLILVIAFASTAAIGFLFAGASWKGCSGFLESSKPHGVLGALGDLIIAILWGVFNIALVPAGLVAPFWVSAKIRNSMKDYVIEAGKIKKVHYTRPTEHDRLIASVSKKRGQVPDLEHRLSNLKSKTTDSLNKLLWTVK